MTERSALAERFWAEAKKLQIWSELQLAFRSNKTVAELLQLRAVPASLHVWHVCLQACIFSLASKEW